eukprot:TCALIF_09711-PA protein Name:"Protein of unknown function" AED:0.02 eAED:0.02 QI:27/1/0.66/1/1/0.66/3/0/416
MNLSLIFITTIVIGIHGQAGPSKHGPLKTLTSNLRSHQSLEPSHDFLNSQFRGSKARIHELLLELLSLYEEEFFSKANPVNWDPNNEPMPPMYENPTINEELHSRANQGSEVSKVKLDSLLKVTSDDPWTIEDISGTTEESLDLLTTYSLNEDWDELPSSSFPLDISTDIPGMDNRIKQESNLRNGGLTPLPQDYDFNSQVSQNSNHHFTTEPLYAKESIEIFTDQYESQFSNPTFLDHSTEGLLDEGETSTAITFNHQMTSVEPLLEKAPTLTNPNTEPFKDLVMNSTEATQSQDPGISSSTNSSHPVKFMMNMMKDYHKEMLHELVSSCDNSTGPCPILPTNKTGTAIEPKTSHSSNTVPTPWARKVEKDPNPDQLVNGPSHGPGNVDAEIAYVDPDYPSAPDVPEGQRVQEVE